MKESNETTPAQRWDAGLYDNQHGFVWKHGLALVELLDPKLGERILDLGCGTGHLMLRIAETGATVIGLDPSAEMLAKARAAHPQLNFVQGDARDFTFSEPFDAIFSNAVLHWIQEPAAVIRCVRNALKVGGRFVAEFGGKGNVETVINALRAAAERVGLPFAALPWYYPSVGPYATILEAAGLEVRFATLFDRPTPLEGSTGLRDWVTQFASWMLNTIPMEKREEFFQALEDAARPKLFREGVWVADYRRLRIIAIREEGHSAKS